jgi:hypothetical protein
MSHLKINNYLVILHGSRHNAVIRLGASPARFYSLQGQEGFHSSKTSTPALGPPAFYLMGTGGSFRGGKTVDALSSILYRG